MAITSASVVTKLRKRSKEGIITTVNVPSLPSQIMYVLPRLPDQLIQDVGLVVVKGIPQDNGQSGKCSPCLVRLLMVWKKVILGNV